MAKKQNSQLTDIEKERAKKLEAENKEFYTLPISKAEVDAIKEVMTAAKVFAKVLKKNKCSLVSIDHGWPEHYLHICPKRIDPRRADAAANAYPDDEKNPRHSILTLPIAKVFGIVEIYDCDGNFELVERKRIKEVAKVLKKP
jgi:hypothetical protein